MRVVLQYKTQGDERLFVQRIARQTWQHLRETTTFTEWVRQGDEHMVERAITHAWELFKEETVCPSD